MWGWLKRIWGNQGCINDQITSTLSPFEPNSKSRTNSTAGGLCTPTQTRNDCSDQGRLQPKYIYSDGKPVGIANTVSKYQESRPVKPHLTPFEARVEAKMAEEEQLSAAVAASSGGIKATGTSPAHSGRGNLDVLPTKQLFTQQDK